MGVIVAGDADYRIALDVDIILVERLRVEQRVLRLVLATADAFDADLFEDIQRTVGMIDHKSFSLVEIGTIGRSACARNSSDSMKRFLCIIMSCCEYWFTSQSYGILSRICKT